jgi:ketosteroid isomerase-like protein
MAKGDKIHDTTEPSTDEYDSCDENIEEIKATMIKKFGKKVFTKTKMLIKKLEKRDRCLEIQ